MGSGSGCGSLLNSMFLKIKSCQAWFLLTSLNILEGRKFLKRSILESTPSWRILISQLFTPMSKVCRGRKTEDENRSKMKVVKLKTKNWKFIFSKEINSRVLIN